MSAASSGPIIRGAMSNRQSPRVLVGLAGLLLGAAVMRGAVSDQAPPTPISREAAEFFEAKIRPLLSERCFSCHTKDEEGGLRLDSRERVIKGGDSGPAIVVGDPEHSLLIKAVRRE